MAGLQPGEMVGQYRIIEKAGYGGMATVYKAYHASMDRYVAIKMMAHEFAQNSEFRDRFQREVRVIARLEHPHILPVYDSGEHDEMPYLVMRYLDTGTLQDKMTERPLTLTEIDHIIRQLGDALAHAHKENVLHRDLKPSNVLLNERGDVFLTDFGIAKLLGDTSQLTATGAMVGTPAYMSPEQAQGENVDLRSDIYSLGIILYEMVTGQVPFQAETPFAVILKHMNDPLPLPTVVQPATHSAIEKVILKALSKKIEDRFPTVGDFLIAWKSALRQAQKHDGTMVGQNLAQSTSSSSATMVSDSPHTAAVPRSRPDKTAVSAPPTAIFPEAEPPEPPLPIPGIPTPKPVRTVPWPWVAGGAVALLVVFALIFGLSALFDGDEPDPDPFGNDNNNNGEPDDNGGADNNDGPGDRPRNPDVTSWTGGSTFGHLRLEDNLLYASGEGGVTIWNLDSGDFERITTADGLLSPWVLSTYRDSEGDLWVATADGLAYFVEDRARNYTREDGLLSEFVVEVVEFDGDIIAATFQSDPGGGVQRLADNEWVSVGFPSEFDNPDAFNGNVYDMVVDENGRLWLANENGLGLYNGETWQRFTTEDGLPHNFVHTVTLDQEDRLMVGTEAGAGWFDGEEFVLLEETEGWTINGILQTEDNLFWFAIDGGIGRYDPEFEEWQMFSEESGDLWVYTVNSVAGTAENLFFGTSGRGLIHYDDDEFVSMEVPNMPQAHAFWHIFPGPEDSLWFAEEYGARLDVFDLEEEEWYSGLEVPCCMIPFFFDYDNWLWGGGDTGVWVITETEQINLTVADGLPSNDIRSMTMDEDGYIWVGTSDAGIAVLDVLEVVELFTAAETGFSSDYIHSLFAADNGSVWVATGGGDRGPVGLSWFIADDEEWEHYTVGDPFSESIAIISSIAEDWDGNIWVATWEDGVWRFDIEEEEWTHFLPNEPGVKLSSWAIEDVAVDDENRIWFATTDGAAYFDGEEWEDFTPQDGLIHPHVYAVYGDYYGDVWLATKGGVTRWDP